MISPKVTQMKSQIETMRLMVSDLNARVQQVERQLTEIDQAASAESGSSR